MLIITMVRLGVVLVDLAQAQFNWLKVSIMIAVLGVSKLSPFINETSDDHQSTQLATPRTTMLLQCRLKHFKSGNDRTDSTVIASITHFQMQSHQTQQNFSLPQHRTRTS
jgi:hypothetical protein